MSKGEVLNEETVCTLGYEGRVYRVVVRMVPGFHLEESVSHSIIGNNTFVSIIDLSTNQEPDKDLSYKVWCAYLERDFVTQTPRFT